jgi:hypothetical protein
VKKYSRHFKLELLHKVLLYVTCWLHGLSSVTMDDTTPPVTFGMDPKSVFCWFLFQYAEIINLVCFGACNKSLQILVLSGLL